MTHPDVALMREIFSWFNTLASPETDVRRADVERYFTSDCEMITNGVTKCRGTEAFVAHFREIREKLRWFEVQPLKKSLAGEGLVAATYEIAFETAGGDAGRIVASVFWTISAGRVQQLEEWVYTTGTDIQFDTID
jgi:hypothetical protein